MFANKRQPILLQFVGHDEVSALEWPCFWQPLILQFAILLAALFFWSIVLLNSQMAMDLLAAILPLGAFERHFPGYHQAVLYVAGSNQLHQLLWFVMLATSIAAAGLALAVGLRRALKRPVTLLPGVSRPFLKLLVGILAMLLVLGALSGLLYAFNSGFMGAFQPEKSKQPVYLVMIMEIMIIAFIVPMLLYFAYLLMVAVLFVRARSSARFA